MQGIGKEDTGAFTEKIRDLKKQREEYEEQEAKLAQDKLHIDINILEDHINSKNNKVFNNKGMEHDGKSHDDIEFFVQHIEKIQKEGLPKKK